MQLNVADVLALLFLPNVGKATALRMIHALKNADYCNSDLRTMLGAVNGRWLYSPEEFSEAREKAASVIKTSDRHGISIVSILDPAYPKALLSNGLIKPPPVLYCKGNIGLLDMPGILIVGTRSPSENGLKAARYLSERLAERGVVIVSGLALGCDSCAHFAALGRPHGKTIAIVGNGLDTVYPSQNNGLSRKIIDSGGLIVSEYPAGTQVSKFTLVERDSLQAAMAMATIVIQSTADGGSMHAARATLAMNKPLFAVEYADADTNLSRLCEGNRNLIAEGAIPLKGNFDPDELVEMCFQHGGLLERGDSWFRQAGSLI